MTTIETMKVAALALAMGAPFGAGVARAAESRASTTTELSAAQTSRAEATKYANLAEQNRQMAASSQARATAEAAAPSTPAPADGKPPEVSDANASAARQYEKIAAFAEKLAANARKVADLHAKAAAALQAQAAVTAKIRR